jgi:hypothetical protein
MEGRGNFAVEMVIHYLLKIAPGWSLHGNQLCPLPISEGHMVSLSARHHFAIGSRPASQKREMGVFRQIEFSEDS